MQLRTIQHNTVGPTVQQHLESLSFNWKTYFSSSSSSTRTESPTWWSSSHWGHQWQDWHSQRVARPRMLGSAITTTTPESRTDLYWEACAGTSERKGLSCCQIHLNPDSICSLLHFSDLLFFLAVSRPDSGNCHEREEECTDNTSPYAHTRTFFSLRTPAHARCEYTFFSSA